MGCHRKAPRTLTNVVSPDDLRAVVASGPHRWRTSLFKERMIYEQSAARTVGEQQEKRPSGLSRQPVKIERKATAIVAPRRRRDRKSAPDTRRYVLPRSNTH